MEVEIISINPGRVLAALGKIGYSPVSAILDIVDNSVSAGATEISISLVVEPVRTGNQGRPRNLLKEVVIVDNGTGMNGDMLRNALALGSNNDHYSKGTLSKFGMGLKSAASSLGKRLEIATRCGGEEVLAILDHDQVVDTGEYTARFGAPDDGMLDGIGGADSGTVVRISKIHQDSLPPFADIEKGIELNAGVIFYYYLAGKAPENGQQVVQLKLDGREILPVDPLFEGEAETNLDETNWDGESVCWITRKKSFQLDPTGQHSAEVEITQLPHPPTLETSGMSRVDVRNKYFISSGNYGFYIYRNHRLISWADHLEGRSGRLVGYNKKLYGFRGRIFLDSNSDNLLNLDVSKSRIMLSELAFDQLKEIISDAVRKSVRAWEYRTAIRNAADGEDPHANANAELGKAAELEMRDDELDEEAAPEERARELEEKRNRATERAQADNDTKRRLREQGERVQYVAALDNNQLWERAHDPELGLVVRVNEAHRFVQDLLRSEALLGTKAVAVLDYLFFALARGEHSFVYKSDYDDGMCEAAMREFRERVGETLSEIIRRSNVGNVFADNSGE